MDDARKLPQRLLVTHAGPEAYAPMARVILTKLGYKIVEPDEFPEAAAELGIESPHLRLVDERTLADVEAEEDPPVPIVVLCGRHGVSGVDPRIVGAIRRPAGLHEIYRLVQQVLEDTPRSTPRVPTHLTARCRRNGREWRGAVLSLSENGCLLRSPETLLLGSRIALGFELPRSGSIEVNAEIAYQLVPDLGVIFNATSPGVREAIGGYVTAVLAGLADTAPA
jgi:PilZ domain